MKFFNVIKLSFCITIMLILISACTNSKSSRVRPAGMDKDTYLNILNEKLPYTNTGIPGAYPSTSSVAIYGKLKVIGTQLCNEQGKPVQLRGLFLRGLINESKFINREAIAWCSDKWKINVLRVPFFSDSWYSDPSYLNNPVFENYIHETVRLCEEFGIYCIIDWHILKDGNPFQHAKEAREFFKKMAFLYGAKKHVIYEICNEPNGNNITWNDVIKPYAEYIIPAIRAGNSNAIIIVGTGTWSQDVQDAAANPLSYENIMYAFHFYAGTHKQYLRDRVNAASDKIALFSTEWGTSDCYAQRGPYLGETKKWLELLNNKKISWCHYALTDFPEGAALLKPNAKSTGGWENDSLSLSGKFIVDQLTNN